MKLGPVTPPDRLWIREWPNDARSVHDEPGEGRHEYAMVGAVKYRSFAELRSAVEACGPLPSVLASSVPYLPTNEADDTFVDDLVARNRPKATVEASVRIGQPLEFVAHPDSFGLEVATDEVDDAWMKAPLTAEEQAAVDACDAGKGEPWGDD